MIIVNSDSPISYEILARYFKSLVNQFFKILPIKEQNEKSLGTYLESLQAELLGCKGLIVSLNSDPSYLTLISILQYLIDYPECTVKEVKREVFKAISICNKLRAACLEERGV